MHSSTCTPATTMFLMPSAAMNPKISLGLSESPSCESAQFNSVQLESSMLIRFESSFAPITMSFSDWLLRAPDPANDCARARDKVN